MVSDTIKVTTTVEDQDYTLELNFSKQMDSEDPEYFSFIAIFFKSMMRMMQFEQIGRNCFNPKQAKTVNNLEIWPGFYSAMNNLEGGALMQIDLTSKVCRKDKVIDHLNDLIRNKNYDHDRVNEEVKNMTVITSYSKAGKHTYKIEKVDFEKTVNDEFEKKDETKISFKDYFKQQYSISIKDHNQPMLMCKDAKTNKDIYLVPELCEMTGLTDAHRADFRLMKDLS